MIYGLILVAAVATGSSRIVEVPLDSHYCPHGAIGYLLVVKDGYRIANGIGYYDRSKDVATAWFPKKGPQVLVAMTLRTSAKGDIQLHTEGRGRILMSRGTFCAYPAETPTPLEVHL